MAGGRPDPFESATGFTSFFGDDN